MEDHVILVNDQDEVTGISEKITAHKNGLLHRAFSIFILNSKDEVLLQRRALSKYHSPGLWSNTCCGHPRPNEHLQTDASRRLMAEMGLNCPISEIGAFIYHAEIDNGLVENEYDHVFIGYSDDSPIVDREEAMDWKWESFGTLAKELHDHPEIYTVWLNVIIGSHLKSFTRPFEWHLG